MATSTSRTVPNSPNPSAQGSPSSRNWSHLRSGEPGSAFRGMGRGRGSQNSGVKGRRGGGHPTNQKGGSHSDTANSSPSSSSKTSSASRKPPVQTSTGPTSNGASVKVVNSSAERAGRPRSGPRKSRGGPAVVVAPASPSDVSQTIPSPASRSVPRRRHTQSGKGIPAATKPPSPTIKTQKSRGSSTPASQTIMCKDATPRLAAAHEAEIRHDLDIFVERVRAVAMADNRPTTPGSHIDWAGDEDDSLPDLDDWGVTTTHSNAAREEGQNQEISPILADALKPLPEPNSGVPEEEEREMETYDAQPELVEESPIRPSSLPSSTEVVAVLPPTADKASEQSVTVPAVLEDSSSLGYADGKPSLHPSLPLKPVAAMESLRARGRSISKSAGLPRKPLVSVTEETSATKTAGLSASIHAPSTDELAALERVTSASSSERGLASSIHAATPSLPESHSAPNLLSGHTSSTARTHSRSHTEGRTGQPHTAPASTVSHQYGRSGATSPLGKHVYTHARNHSTPAGGAGSRQPQTSRPVITGEAISRLARTIGGIGPAPRAQSIPVTKDSGISS